MSWVSLNLKYHKFVGSWAWILHRITGLMLTGYIMLHIYALSGLQKGPKAFHVEMKIFTQPIFLLFEWLLFGVVIYHALNGIRIAIVDLWGGSKAQRALFWSFGFIALAMFVGMGLLMYFNHQTLDYRPDGSVRIIP